jgi:hypothetical protein
MPFKPSGKIKKTTQLKYRFFRAQQNSPGQPVVVVRGAGEAAQETLVSE